MGGHGDRPDSTAPHQHLFDGNFSHHDFLFRSIARRYRFGKKTDDRELRADIRAEIVFAWLVPQHSWAMRRFNVRNVVVSEQSAIRFKFALPNVGDGIRICPRGLSLFQQQQLYFHLQPRIGQGGVIDPDHRRIGDELAGNREFVVGQSVDKELTRCHRLRPAKGQSRPRAAMMLKAWPR